MEDVWREALIKGERCWRLKDFWRESRVKAARALQSDSETSFIANCSLLIANLKDAFGEAAL
jgi:hypothetical protein